MGRLRDPQDAYDGAQLVVLGTPTSTRGTRDVFGQSATVHLVLVDEVLKSTLDADLVEVSSTPVTAAGATTRTPTATRSLSRARSSSPSPTRRADGG